MDGESIDEVRTCYSIQPTEEELCVGMFWIVEVSIFYGGVGGWLRRGNIARYNCFLPVVAYSTLWPECLY